MVNNKRIIIIGAVVLFVIIASVFFVLRNAGNQPKATPTPTPTTQSGEVAVPDFGNLSDLLTIGVTYTQLEDLKYTLYQYRKTGKQVFSNVSVDPSSIEVAPHNRSNAPTVDVVRFWLVLDDKITLKAKMDYYDLSAIRLYLYDETNTTLLYDSQKVEYQSLNL